MVKLWAGGGGLGQLSDGHLGFGVLTWKEKHYFVKIYILGVGG